MIFDVEIQLRQEVAGRYNMSLKEVVKVPSVREENISAWAQYSVLHNEWERIINKLRLSNNTFKIYLFPRETEKTAYFL